MLLTLLMPWELVDSLLLNDTQQRDDIEYRRSIRAAVVTGYLTLRINPNFTPI
jgi:hypothetical protein